MNDLVKENLEQVQELVDEALVARDSEAREENQKPTDPKSKVEGEQVPF